MLIRNKKTVFFWPRSLYRYAFSKYHRSGNYTNILNNCVCTTLAEQKIDCLCNSSLLVCQFTIDKKGANFFRGIQNINRETELSEWVFLCQFTLDPIGTNFSWGRIWPSKVIYNRYIKTTLSNLTSNLSYNYIFKMQKWNFNGKLHLYFCIFNVSY